MHSPGPSTRRQQWPSIFCFYYCFHSFFVFILMLEVLVRRLAIAQTLTNLLQAKKHAFTFDDLFNRAGAPLSVVQNAIGAAVAFTRRKVLLIKRNKME